MAHIEDKPRYFNYLQACRDHALTTILCQIKLPAGHGSTRSYPGRFRHHGTHRPVRQDSTADFLITNRSVDLIGDNIDIALPCTADLDGLDFLDCSGPFFGKGNDLGQYGAWRCGYPVIFATGFPRL